MTGALRYVDDSRRASRAGGTAAIGNISTPTGKRITDRDEIDRLNAIGLPPAYRDAWFCPSAERPYPGDRL